MVETRQMIHLALAFLSLGLFGWLYALGGRQMKALRRYVASSIFVAVCLGLAAASGHFSWWMLASWPCLAAALCMGYGANTFMAKVRRRALYGLAVGAASAPFLLPISMETFLFQVILAVCVSVFYGVWNPTSAVAEEGAIGMLMVICWPFAAIR